MRATEDGFDKVVFFTDSMAACKMLQNVSSTNYLVADIHNKINVSSINECYIIWVPSHSGIEWNEEVDYLAKYACDVGAVIKPKLTDKEAIYSMKQKLKTICQEKYETISQSKGRHLFKIFPIIPDKPWYDKIDMSTKDIKLINRLLVGHTYDKTYLSRIGVERTSICVECNTEETAEHSLLKRKKYEEIRRKYKILNGELSLLDLLKGKNVVNYRTIVKFYNEIRLDI